MAKNEGEFKPEFKKQLSGFYKEATIWSSNDMFQVGIPDLNILNDGIYFSVEAKFINKLPVRQESKVLAHEVTPKQILHLGRILKSGGVPVILIGMPDVLVWTMEIKNNYSLKELLLMKRYPKINGIWQLNGLLEDIESNLIKC